MNFDFSDDSKLLREQAQRFLREHCTPKVVRHVLEGHAPYSPALWQAMAEMGWLAAAIPDRYDGAGLGYEALCVLAEELGRVLAPVPFISTVCLAAEAILAGGSEAQKREYLPKIVRGELVATFALAEGAGEPREANLRARIADGRNSGSKWPTPDGSIAQFAVVAARDTLGVVLALVDLAASGVTRSTVPMVDPSRSRQTRFRQRTRCTARHRRARLGHGAAAAGSRRHPERVRSGGWCRGIAGDGDRLCQGTFRVRSADRIVPGDQAQAGRCIRCHRAGAVQRVLRRMGIVR
jgi:alkylation response protein AidB-like acyl-CoA dehydrogenase